MQARAVPLAIASSFKSAAYGALPGIPTTYVLVPLANRFATAVFVPSSSRHEPGPYGPDRSQQLVPAGQPNCRSMFGMQALASHAARGLQFGPPSVARRTTVRPRRAATVGSSAVKVAAVGVAPFGLTSDGKLIAREKPRVTGPSVPQIPSRMGSPG